MRVGNILLLTGTWAVLACGADAPPGRVLVFTPGAGDYLLGAGGTLARMIGEGHEVVIVQVTNDEKNSDGLGPAETQQANRDEGRAAARLLGAREVIGLGHKAGELGYISSTELRHEMFGLIRYFKPRILMIPDPYIHYDAVRDRHYVGKAAEEAWGYSGGGTFGADLTREGLGPYGAPEIYYYSAGRPYRAGEGGDERAAFLPVDITGTFDRKLRALLELRTTNRLYAAETRQRLTEQGRPSRLLTDLTQPSIDALVRAYVEEMATTIGAKHGFRYGEEFNHVGGQGGLQEHILERARPRRP